MGDFAVNVAMSYQIGAARGIFSILSAMDISRDEFFSHIGRSINSLVLKHRCDLDRKRLIIAVQRLLKERGILPWRSDWRIRCCYQCSGSAVRNGR